MRRLDLMKCRVVLAPALFVTLALGLASTVEARINPAPNSTRAASNLAAHQVQMAEFSYTPNSLTNNVNDPATVTVTNTGREAHTFTINGVVDSGSIAAGQSRAVQFTPTQAGMLTFYCTIHGLNVMSGRMNVVAAATSPAQPTQQPAQPQAQQPPVQQPAAQQPAPPPPRPLMPVQPPSTGDAGLLSILAQ
jgi:plastocyanin